MLIISKFDVAPRAPHTIGSGQTFGALNGSIQNDCAYNYPSYRIIQAASRLSQCERSMNRNNQNRQFFGVYVFATSKFLLRLTTTTTNLHVT